MKKIFTFLTVLILVTAYCGTATGLHAQTSTNSFIVTPSAPVTIQPEIVSSSLTVQSIFIDPVNKQMTIRFVGVVKPVLVKGVAFTAFKAQFQGTFATAIAAYIQANPPQ